MPQNTWGHKRTHAGVNSLQCGTQVSNLGSRTWQQEPLPSGKIFKGS